MGQPGINTTYDICIVGAGLVGLATAHSLINKHPDLKILLLEKENAEAQHQSGHNSGVIHSGIYYKPGSQKAINCRRGYDLLIDYCKKHQVPYDICGKIIVATEESELPGLQTIYDRGVENGLAGLRFLKAEEIKEYEPHCTGIKAILVPQAGICDYPKLAESLLEQIKSLGVEVRFSSEAKNLSHHPEGVEISTKNHKFIAKNLISCAGLYSDALAKMSGLKTEFQIIPFRGEYYKLKPESYHLG